MQRSEIHLDQWVIYQGRPDGPREDGTVVSLHALERGLASVLYRGDTTAKATYISDLTPGRLP